MKRALIVAVVLFLAATCFAADLQSDLQKMASAYPGKVAVFAKNLKTGATVAIDADTPVQTASVIKLAVMIEAFYQVKAGKLDLSKRLSLTKADQVPGSGALAYIEPDVELSLKDTITLMMILSDNTATNMTLDQVGIANVNARLAAMGMKNTYLYKKVFKPAEGPMPPDQPKFGLGKTTAREMAEILESVERCDLKDQALCDTMIKIMRGQQDHDMIPRYIANDKDVPHPQWIADKIGALNDVRNDVALVQMKNAPLIISIFTWDNQDKRWSPENAGEILIGSMARRIVQEWGEPVIPEKPAAKP
jgi:beta-lactamase class A